MGAEISKAAAVPRRGRNSAGSSVCPTAVLAANNTHLLVYSIVYSQVAALDGAQFRRFVLVATNAAVGFFFGCGLVFVFFETLLRHLGVSTARVHVSDPLHIRSLYMMSSTDANHQRLLPSMGRCVSCFWTRSS